MVARTFSRPRNIIGGIGGHQHLVNHVNDAVAGVHVGKGHACPVDLHAVPDGKGKGLSVYSLSRHAVGESGGWNIACDDVVKQNIRQSNFAFWRVQGCEVDACVSKGLVGWCKDGERTRALKGFQEFSLDNGSNKRVVVARALSSSWDVVGCIRR